jgi:hypothetical protein
MKAALQPEGLKLATKKLVPRLRQQEMSAPVRQSKGKPLPPPEEMGREGGREWVDSQLQCLEELVVLGVGPALARLGDGGRRSSRTPVGPRAQERRRLGTVAGRSRSRSLGTVAGRSRAGRRHSSTARGSGLVAGSRGDVAWPPPGMWPVRAQERGKEERGERSEGRESRLGEGTRATAAARDQGQGAVRSKGGAAAAS